MIGVYLLHFDKPYKHAKHYLGWSSNVESRLVAHRSGNGARLIEVLRQNAIGVQLVRVWPWQTRTFERKLKKQHGAVELCPICTPNAGQGRWRPKDIGKHKAIIKDGKCILCRRRAHRVVINNSFSYTRHIPKHKIDLSRY